MLVNFKPISNIVKKAAIRILPMKSSFLEVGLKPLSRDIVDFAPQKPVVKSYAAIKLKKYYNSKGVPFLLPHQEWSDQKISETIKVLGKSLDRLAQTEALNKKTLQELINKLAPEAKGKIIVKDFSDLRRDLEKSKVSPNDISLFLQSEAMANSEYKKTVLYFKFERLNEGPSGEIELKCSVEHELTHAMNHRLKNGLILDDFKNDNYKCAKQKDSFDQLFNRFEKSYNSYYPSSKTEITNQNMLDCLGFNSTEHLHKHFEKTFNQMIVNSALRGEINLGADKKSLKQFLNYMKNRALDEKSAYRSNIRYREVSENPESPTGFELMPLLYDEMAKFFAQKRIEANKFFV